MMTATDARVRLDAFLKRDDRTELIFGFTRPAAVSPLMSAIVPQLQEALTSQLDATATVLSAPLWVVLDAARALVLRPALALLPQTERSVVGRQVWGPPVVVVEVACTMTARRIRTTHLRWYRGYGVKECWILDARYQRVEVHDLNKFVDSVPRIFGDTVRSNAYPDVHIPVATIFAGLTSASARPAREKRSA